MNFAHAIPRLLLMGALLVASSGAAAAQAARDDAGAAPMRGVVDGEDIVHTAERYLGVPYRWGGTTPKAFDCSGFVRYVFGKYGIELPRTAREQVAIGSTPLPGDLQPGDLLFFYGGRGAQHVAIYVGGDTIIHASSSSRRVRFDELSSSGSHRNWFDRRLIAVRRLLPVDVVFMLPTVSEVDSTSGRHSAGDAGSADRSRQSMH